MTASPELLARPVVATGRGGSGTRLLSLLLQEHGIFLGNEFNGSGDSIEWVDAIYELAIAKLSGNVSFQARGRRLPAVGASVLTKGGCRERARWGWKLPETMLIVPEVLEAFPQAQLIHLVRHPVDTCLRRTHLSSRMDNRIGVATLLAAYQRLNWPRDPRTDEDYLRNAASWVFQVEQVMEHGRGLNPRQYLEIQFEELRADPQSTSDKIAEFLGTRPIVSHLAETIDSARGRERLSSDERAAEIWSICGSAAAALGYRLK